MGRKTSAIHTLLSVWGTIAALVTLTGPAPSLASTLECFQYNLKAHLGHEASQSDATSLEFYDPDSRYFELGTGVGGGSVYRVLPPNGKPAYVLKEYHVPKMRDSDVVTFDRLHRFMPPVNGIEIVRPETIGKKSMRLPNIEGVALNKVLQDLSLSTAEKKRLLEIWNHFIDTANRALTQGPNIHDHEIFTLHPIHTFNLRFFENGRRYTVWLKPDNVIVQSKTGRMFVIDPF